MIVQLTKSYKDDVKFLCLNKLQQALHDDPDLTDIPVDMRSQAIQTLYICTGCDYVSFSGMEKQVFIQHFSNMHSLLQKVILWEALELLHSHATTHSGLSCN